LLQTLPASPLVVNHSHRDGVGGQFQCEDLWKCTLREKYIARSIGDRHVDICAPGHKASRLTRIPVLNPVDVAAEYFEDGFVGVIKAKLSFSIG
jgi:hypothetical protein